MHLAANHTDLDQEAHSIAAPTLRPGPSHSVTIEQQRHIAMVRYTPESPAAAPPGYEHADQRCASLPAIADDLGKSVWGL
jgi:hypothetical protein